MRELKTTQNAPAGEPPKKVDHLAALMQAGEWETAIKFAARFPRLEQHRGPILTAASALLSPDLYRGMGKDPAALVAAGVEALRDRYARYL